MTDIEKARKVALRYIEVEVEFIADHIDCHAIDGNMTDAGRIKVSDLLPDEDDLGGYVSSGLLRKELEKLSDEMLALWIARESESVPR